MKSTALPRNLSDWLARKPKEKAPRKRIPAMSAKRKKEAREYSKKRETFLRLRPLCERWQKRWEAVSNHGPFIILEGKCGRLADDVHHMKGRLDGNYLDDLTWLPVCRSCHDWIHTHPKEARALGLLA